MSAPVLAFRNRNPRTTLPAALLERLARLDAEDLQLIERYVKALNQAPKRLPPSSGAGDAA